jgi:type VI secretion system protein ImpF
MSPPDHNNLVPSVLDRLLGEELPTDADLVRFRARFIRRRKEALCRDLENLLNTRRRCTAPPPDLTDLERSLVDYGIPDFTGTNAESLGGRDELLHAIEVAIDRYEPRLRQIRIVPVTSSGSSYKRVLRFRIEGVMLTDGDPEPVAFTSVMEPSSGNFLLERDTQ